MDDKKTSNLSVLRTALRYIQVCWGGRVGRCRGGRSASFLLLPAGSPARLHAGAEHMAWLTSAGLPAREGEGRRAPAQEGSGASHFSLPLPHVPRLLNPSGDKGTKRSHHLPTHSTRDPGSGQGRSLVGVNECLCSLLGAQHYGRGGALRQAG